MTETLIKEITGVQMPRISNIPDIQSAQGFQDAVDLAESYGLHLFEWQQTVLKSILNEQFNSKWVSPRCGLSCPRQNGKNVILEARELYGLVILGERILHTAQLLGTAKSQFERLLVLLDHPDLKKLVKKVSYTNGEQQIIMHKRPGQTHEAFIKFAARTKLTGRGLTIDLLVCDEAQNMDDDKFGAISSTTTSVANPQTLLFGTPPKPQEDGEVFERYREAGTGGKDEKFAWFEWSAEEDADLASVEQWATANPSLGLWIPLENLENQKAGLSDSDFAREALGMWSGLSAITVVDMKKWAKIGPPQHPEPPRAPVKIRKPIVFAIDVAPNRDSASISMASYTNDGKIYTEVVAYDSGTSWVVNRVAQLKEHWSPVAIIIDQGSPADVLSQDFKAAHIRITHTGMTEMMQACGFYVDCVNEERLMHDGQVELELALVNATKRKIREGFGWDRKNSGADITPLVSSTLAVFGLHTKRTPPTSDDDESGGSETKTRRVLQTKVVV